MHERQRGDGPDGPRHGTVLRDIATERKKPWGPPVWGSKDAQGSEKTFGSSCSRDAATLKGGVGDGVSP